MKWMLPLALGATFIITAVGCGSQNSAPSKNDDHSHADHGHDDHGHDHAAGHTHGDPPHGGTLLDWGGGKYHVELVVNHDKQEAIVYILGEDAKTPLPIAAEKVVVSLDDPAVEIDFLPQPLDGESAGNASRFVAMHEAFAPHKALAGSVAGEVEGTPYVADFKESDTSHAH